MAAETEEAYRISGEQLIAQKEQRNIVHGCLSFDIGIGGGVPEGCTIVIGGRSGLGKTTLSMNLGAAAQHSFKKKVFIYPIEGRLTERIFKQVPNLKLGQDDLEIVMPPAIIKDKKIIGHKKWSSQHWWTTIGETIKDNPGNVHIVDSIANLSSEKEFSEGMGFQGRGEDKKWESQFCRIYGDDIVASGSILFLLTHIQANTSGYGAPIQLKLGNHFKHQADLILFGKSIDKWAEENGRIMGHDMIYHVEKNSFGPPYMDIRIPLQYGRGIAYVKDIYTHGLNLGMIKNGGSWYHLPFTESGEYIDLPEDLKDKKSTHIKMQGEATVRKFFEEHPDSLKVLEDKVRAITIG